MLACWHFTSTQHLTELAVDFRYCSHVTQNKNPKTNQTCDSSHLIKVPSQVATQDTAESSLYKRESEVSVTI